MQIISREYPDLDHPKLRSHITALTCRPVHRGDRNHDHRLHQPFIPNGSLYLHGRPVRLLTDKMKHLFPFIILSHPSISNIIPAHR